jgi:hypothetical protein
MAFNLGSIDWLTIVKGIFKSLRGRLLRRVVKVKAYVEDLLGLEEMSAGSNLITKLKAIRDGDTSVVITVQDAAWGVGDGSGANNAQGLGFFGLWAKYFRKPVKRVAALFDDDKAAGMVFAGIDTALDDLENQAGEGDDGPSD